jgi:hypothetical protein
MAADQRPGIPEVLQNLIIDDAVDAVGQIEWHRFGFHIGRGHLIHVPSGDGGGGGIGFDTQQARCGIHRTVGGCQRPISAADVKNGSRPQRNARQ